MLGRNHILLNIGFVTASVCALAAMSARYPLCYAVFDEGWRFLYPADSLNYPWLWTGALLGAVALGSVLPDIDNKSSIVGRYIHLPLKHRTLTHTFWVLTLLFFAAVRWPAMAALWAGYFLHIIEDSVSVSGVCWMWPFERYRVYPSGARVKPHHSVRLYRTGYASEGAFLAVFIGIFMIVILFCGLRFNGFQIFARKIVTGV